MSVNDNPKDVLALVFVLVVTGIPGILFGWVLELPEPIRTIVWTILTPFLFLYKLVIVAVFYVLRAIGIF